jgi:hypothetical protein
VGANLKNSLYKIELLVLKGLPFSLAVCAFLSTIFDYISINSTIINYVMVFLIYAFILISSNVFQFCFYHRLPLYYIIVVNLLSIIDVYIGIPLNDYNLFQLYFILTGLFILFTIIAYVKAHKKISSKNN